MHALALGKPVVARDIPATREILATFLTVEGVYLYESDSELPELVRAAVAFGHSTVVEREPSDWNEWSRGLFEFATSLTSSPDLYDRLMDRIEDGDTLRFRHSVGNAASQSSSSLHLLQEMTWIAVQRKNLARIRCDCRCCFDPCAR